MNQALTLLKKEWMESLRNFKFIAFVIVMLIFGILSPLTALLMPEILGAALKEQFEGLVLPDPTAYDSFVQFFSNINQMGMLLLVILFGSLLTNEFSRGTLTNLVTKGLKRRNIIAVKFLFVVIVWTIGYVLSAATTYMYTIMYWDETLHNLWFSLLTSYVYGIFLIALAFMLSIWVKNFVGVLGIMLGIIVVFTLISISPDAAEWLPNYLISSNMDLVTGELEMNEVVPALLITLGAIAVFIVVAIMSFDKSEI